MKKILFGITSLTLGGAERVLVDLANALCDKYEITIFTIYAKGELEKQLNNKIKLKSLYDEAYLELLPLKRKFVVPLEVLLLKKKIYKKCIQCLSPAKKYKLYKSSINKSLHFAQRSLSSSTRG